MRRITAMVGAAAVVMMTAGVFAQAKPSFAGKWTLVPDPNAAAAGGGGGGGRRGGGGGGGGGGFACGMECTITQDATTLTITRTVAGREGGAPTEVKTVLKLDGTDSSNPGRGGGDPIISKAKVEGDKLVVSTTRTQGENTVTATQTVSIVGGNLVVVSSSGREGAAPVTTTYKKN